MYSFMYPRNSIEAYSEKVIKKVVYKCTFSYIAGTSIFGKQHQLALKDLKK